MTLTIIKILIKVFFLKITGKILSHGHVFASFWSTGWLVCIEPEAYTSSYKEFLNLLMVIYFHYYLLLLCGHTARSFEVYNAINPD